jgi:two-component system response regulator PilR (NtrC family)
VGFRSKIRSIFRRGNDPGVPVRLLVSGRLGLVFVALLSSCFATFFRSAEISKSSQFLYTPLALIFGFCALSAIYLNKHRPGKIFQTIQVAADIIIVTGVLYITGGMESPFLFLYLFLAISSGILFNKTTAICASIGCVAAYIGLILFTENGILSGTPQGVSYYDLSLNCLIIGISGLFLALLTSNMTQKFRSHASIVEEAKRSLDKMSKEQRALIDEIPEGVITASPEEFITSVNRAGEFLLGIREHVFLGKTLKESLNEVSSEFKIMPVTPGSPSVPRELELLNHATKKTLRISYFARALLNHENELIGYVYLFQDVTKLRSFEEQLAIQEKMARLLSEESKTIATSVRGEALIGESQVFNKVLDLIARVAPTDATVLISGESGTGKELVARAIHNQSPRKMMPFVAVNCGAIPSELIESELFGHKKGSFTGAVGDALGLVRRADRGTLFLDEIGELPIAMQSKLLRMLQEQTVHAVGGEKDVQVDVRIVAATNRNLKNEMAEGRFREDLFYRLNVVNVALPPLRDRKEDIPVLVKRFLQRYGREESSAIVSPAAMSLIMNYSYPGNIRELENILERAVVLGNEVILPEHLPEQVHASANSGVRIIPSSGEKHTDIIIDENLNLPIRLDDILNEVERKYILCALEQTNGARKKAADLLGINFRSLRYRLQKFGMKEE